MTEPADANVVVGTAVTFSVSATGDAPLGYQWLRDGAPIVGATDASYTLASPGLADHGARFSVVVSNATGSVTSRTATLSVSASPGIAILAGAIGGAGHVDATGSAARLDSPAGVVVGPGGDIYVSENTVIRKVTQLGEVSTFTGKYLDGALADGSLAAARVRRPAGLCFDAGGNLFVADYLANNIRKITPAGTVSTFAGSTIGSVGTTDATGTLARFNQPWGVVVDSTGNLFVADCSNHTIRKITPAGLVTTFAGTAGLGGTTDGTGAAARFNRPHGLAIDGADNLYVVDTGNNRIRKVDAAGVVSTLAGSAAGSSDGIGAAASFNSPWGIALVGGTLYVADAYNNKIRVVTLAGVVTTLAGQGSPGSTDGPGATARFDLPMWIAGDAAGNLYVADNTNSVVRKVTAAGAVSTLAGMAPHFGATDGSAAIARFLGPRGVAMDAVGNAYVADTGNHLIRKIAPDGTTTTLAGTTASPGTVDGTAGSARFWAPEGVAVDAAGNVYVADTGNHMIRKIAPGGVVTTLAGNGAPGGVDGAGKAARFSSPRRLCVDGAGNVYVADTSNHAIRRITPAGDVTTFAGSLGAWGMVNDVGTAARFNEPRGIAIDAAGALFVADSQNGRIRRIAPDGTVTTFAGAGPFGSVDGTGTACTFGWNHDITIDATGNLYVCDNLFKLVRKIDAGATVTTLFGQSDRAGIQTGAAPGSFNSPVSVAVHPAGKLLYLADPGEHTLLSITLV